MDIYDPLDTQQQHAMLWGHPLVTTDYVAVTPSLPKVLAEVVDAVMLHKGSLVFKAYPRMGKTTACRFVVAALSQHLAFADRFVLRVSADTKEERKRRENIVRIMAKALDLKVASRAPLASIRDDVANFIESRLRNRGGRHWVLCLDEIQTLTIEEFQDLQYLQNGLALHNIDTTLIGFGQTQIDHLVTLLDGQKRAELTARFLCNVKDLPHCSEPAWMAETLKGYDEHFTYPEGSGCTYTQFFLPRAYAAGFRMNEIASDIYQVMSSSARASNLPVLPTALIFDVFRLILIRAMKEDAGIFSITKLNIKNAIEEARLSGYVKIIEQIGVK